MNIEVFVQNIKGFCHKKGETPTNACKNSGVGASFISDLHRGRTPSVAKVQMLAEYLGVTTSQLLGEVEAVTLPGVGSVTPEELELLRLFRESPDRFRAAALELMRAARTPAP